MRVVRRRVYTVNVPPLPVEKVYERLASAVRTAFAEIRVEGGRASIAVVGTEAQLREAWASIKEAVTQLWELYRLLSGGEATIEAIAREAGRTFPPEALVEALRLMGYEATLDEDKTVLRTAAPSEKVVEAARRIAEVMDEIRFSVRGSAAKKLVAALSAGLGVPADAVIEYGLRSRVFIRDDEGKVRLRMEWRQGLRRLAVMLKAAREAGWPNLEGGEHYAGHEAAEEGG